MSRRALLENVWGLDEGTDTRAIDNFIVRLRRYIEDRATRRVSCKPSAASVTSSFRTPPPSYGFTSVTYRYVPDCSINVACAAGTCHRCSASAAVGPAGQCRRG